MTFYSLFFLKKKIVFINDYHLLLVPEMLRELIPDAPIGLFLHATFPSSEIFRCLSSKLYYKIITYLEIGIRILTHFFIARNELLQGLLGANLVGFQVKKRDRKNKKKTFN